MVTILGEGAFQLWIGVAYAGIVERVLPVHCQFLGYGVLHLDCSVLLGFYPIMLLIYWQYGETSWESTL